MRTIINFISIFDIILALALLLGSTILIWIAGGRDLGYSSVGGVAFTNGVLYKFTIFLIFSMPVATFACALLARKHNSLVLALAPFVYVATVVFILFFFLYPKLSAKGQAGNLSASLNAVGKFSTLNQDFSDNHPPEYDFLTVENGILKRYAYNNQTGHVISNGFVEGKFDSSNTLILSKLFDNLRNYKNTKEKTVFDLYTVKDSTGKSVN